MEDRMDDRLKAQWAADVPTSDPRFVLSVMARIEQRRFRRELATTVGLALCAVILLGLAAPSLELVWHASIAPYVSNLSIFLTLMAATMALPLLFPARD